jgi:cation diffusion facilitator family transporter
VNSTPPDPQADVRARAQAAAALVVRGMALNLVLAVLKLTGGFFGQTYALIADGAESLLDVLSSLLVWMGFRVASRPPDADHPYGHGKAEPLAALAVAVFIFVAAGGISSRAIHLIITPHEVPHVWTLPLLAGVVAAKVGFSRRIGAAGAKAGSTALVIEAWHHWTDAITSAAAFVGIAIAIIWHWPAADDWAALFACVVIAYNGVAIFQKALGDVMDTAVSVAFEQEVRTVALAVAGVRSLDKCRVRKSGLSHLVDIHVRVDGDLTVREGHKIAHAVKDALLASVPHTISDVSVHIEPTK